MNAVRLTLAAALVALAAAAFAQSPGAPQTGAAVSRAAASTPQTLAWQDLVPADFRLDDLLARFQQESLTLNDGDPRAQKLLQELADAYKAAPVVPALDGRLVRLPGFVVPLDGDLKNMKSFLLVPYFGACIHTPPPPSNQIVHVVSDKPLKAADLMADAVWVTGVMSVKASQTELADAGYVLKVRDVKPYRPDAK
jgi:hypothetical protein